MTEEGEGMEEERKENKIDWVGLVRLVIREINKLDDKQEKLLKNFKPDFTVAERQKDQYFLKIGEDEYRVGYIFLRNLFLVYKDGKMVIELENKS